MRKISPAILLTAVMVLFLLSATASAQSAPQWEIFGGGTWLRADISPDLQDFGLAHVRAIGWNFSGTQNATNWFGVTLDLSGAYSRPEIIVSPTETLTNEFNFSVYTFMAGPTFALRRSDRIVPFGRVLLGAVHDRVKTTSKGALLIGDVSASETHFGVGAGGGVDVAISRMLAVRGTADLIHSTFGDFDDDRQNSVRVSAGIVFRFGMKP